MRRLVLHVGNPKTGTTSLQQFFFDSRRALLERGVLYPVLENRPRNSHSNMVWQHTGQRNYDASGITFESLEALARTCDWDTLLVSSEFLSLTRKDDKTAGAIAALIDTFKLDLTIVAFLRPQHVWMNSAYCQATKTFVNHLSFTEHLWRTADNRRYDYRKSMEVWMDWPNAAFAACPFSSRYLTPDLETCFAAAAGLDVEMAPILANSPRQAKNVTPGPYEVEISRRLARDAGNNSTWPAGTKGRLRKSIRQAVLFRGWDAAPFNGVDNDTRGRIEERFGGSNEAFAQRTWGKSWNAVFDDDYSRDLTVNDLVQTGISAADEAAIAGIVEAATGLLGTTPS